MRRIIQIDDCGQVISKYDSIAKAAEFHECDESSIRKVLDKPGRKSCGYSWMTEQSEESSIKTIEHAGPKVLLLDIETAPLLAYVFQKSLWKARINDEKVLSDWFILTYSCKWLNEPVVYSNKLTGAEAILEDDSRIVKELWGYLNQADIVIAHNGKYFDIPNMNTRFILNGLPPTTPYRQIDTLDVAKKQFGFSHNNLNGLAAVFGLGSKIDTTFDLWKRCLHGDDEALNEMMVYNVHDVELLEQVYMYLRPWIKSHATFALYNDDDETQCPYCGHKHFKESGFYYTLTGRYQTYQCLQCGGISRVRKSDTPKTKELLISIPGK